MSRTVLVLLLLLYALGAMTFIYLGIGEVRKGEDAWAAWMFFFAGYFVIRFAVLSE